jgi:hypothetical protein
MMKDFLIFIRSIAYDIQHQYNRQHDGEGCAISVNAETIMNVADKLSS